MNDTTQNTDGAGRIAALARQHPDLMTAEFWDQLYSSLQRLAAGGAEQICIERTARTGPFQVEVNQMTTGSTAGGVAGQTPKV